MISQLPKWELDYKEGWALKNWCFQTLVLQKTLQSPLDSKKIKPVNPKGNQHWIFIGRTDTEAEVPILWSPDVKSQLIGKDPDAGKDWGQGQKGLTEDEMVGWHHWLNGHEFEWSLRDNKGQGSLVCCSSWGLRVRHNLVNGGSEQEEPRAVREWLRCGHWGKTLSKEETFELRPNWTKKSPWTLVPLKQEQEASEKTLGSEAERRLGWQEQMWRKTHWRNGPDHAGRAWKECSVHFPRVKVLWLIWFICHLTWVL